MGKVSYNQSGYVGCSMSERAVMAYESGEKPKSKWTKAAMVAEIESYCDDYDLPLPDLTGMTKDEIWREFFEWKSWHHTGKYANVTDFYGLNERAVDRRTA